MCIGRGEGAKGRNNRFVACMYWVLVKIEKDWLAFFSDTLWPSPQYTLHSCEFCGVSYEITVGCSVYCVVKKWCIVRKD